MVYVELAFSGKKSVERSTYFLRRMVTRSQYVGIDAAKDKHGGYSYTSYSAS